MTLLKHPDDEVRSSAFEEAFNILISDSLAADGAKSSWDVLMYNFFQCAEVFAQQNLADRIRTAILSLSTRNSIVFLNAFWRTIASLWYTIDQDRLGKFYNLQRDMLFAGFQVLEKENWNPKVLIEYLEMLASEDCPLEINGTAPLSIQMFAVQNYLEILNTVNPPEDATSQLLMPFSEMLVKTKDNDMFLCIKECVFDCL